MISYPQDDKRAVALTSLSTNTANMDGERITEDHLELDRIFGPCYIWGCPSSVWPVLDSQLSRAE